MAPLPTVPSTSPSVTLGIIGGALVLFGLFCAFKAFCGIVRRETSFWYRPFSLSYEMPKMLREVKVTGWKAVAVGLVYAVLAAGMLLFGGSMLVPLIRVHAIE